MFATYTKAQKAVFGKLVSQGNSLYVDGSGYHFNEISFTTFREFFSFCKDQLDKQPITLVEYAFRNTTNKENNMQCELCFHEVDENEIEVLEIYNDYYGEAERFWACPDCVDKNALKKDQDTLDKQPITLVSYRYDEQ